MPTHPHRTRETWQRLGRHWRSLLGVVALAVAVAAVSVFLVFPPTYESTGHLFVETGGDASGEAYSSLYYAQEETASFADLGLNAGLYEHVVDTLDLSRSPEALTSVLSAERVEETSLIEVTARAGDPRLAQEIAAAAVEYVTRFVNEFEQGEGIAVRPVGEPSYNPDRPHPRPLLGLGAAALVGLLMGVAMINLREELDGTVRSGDDVVAATDTPVLVPLRHDAALAAGTAAPDPEDRPAHTEAFRLLGTQLGWYGHEQGPGSMMVTSPGPHEGKTVTATGLALLLARSGRRVALVDADLRSPGVATTLDLDPAVGLTSVLLGTCDLDTAVQVHRSSGLHVLTSGEDPAANPGEILGSAAAREVFRRLHDSYDTVVIDAPPTLPVADASTLAARVDAVLVTARYDHTTQAQLEETVHRIRNAGGRLAGVVTTMVPDRAGTASY